MRSHISVVVFVVATCSVSVALLSARSLAQRAGGTAAKLRLIRRPTP